MITLVFESQPDSTTNAPRTVDAIELIDYHEDTVDQLPSAYEQLLGKTVPLAHTGRVITCVCVCVCV